MFKYLIRALRLPFITASVIPFVFGSLIAKENFNILGFSLGLAAVIFTHLSANLINDYADSKSRADWQDKRFFGFFGGSKLIQEGIFPEKFYFRLAILFAGLSLFCVIGLSLLLRSFFAFWMYIAIIFLAWSYTHGPLRFSYRMMGEFIVFILFGMAPVMGGYFIQTGIFPDTRSLLMSLPFGFFTVAVLFANEVPDYSEDKKAGKITWVNILGQKYSFVLYYLLILCGFFAITWNFCLGYLGTVALFSLMLIFPATKAVNIIRRDYADKPKLVVSSKLTIGMQAVIGIILILDLVI